MTKEELLTILEIAEQVAHWDADDLGHPGVRATQQYLKLARQRAGMIEGPLDGALVAQDMGITLCITWAQA